MQRRRWLQLGLGAAAVLAVGGGAALLWTPGLQAGHLTPAGRAVFLHVGRALLDGSLPTEPGARDQALAAFVQRVDETVAALPAHAQGELSQLLALLAGAPGRRGLAGLAPDWPDASIAQIQQALQGMRVSRLALRRQAYQALHDLSGAAFFADPSAWPILGYPGPRTLTA
ncbi:MAG: hypothetical protein NDI68_06890 [Arenimonas sp.]|nr:hypothetical protein [Arenimonas sp.]